MEQDELIELDSESIHDFARNVSTVILFDLIRENKVDLERCSDREYVVKSVIDNIPENLPTVIDTSDRTIESAKSVVKSDKWSALILACAAIEHEFNIYYQNFLGLRDFSDKDAKEIIRSTNFHIKTTWLMKLTTDRELPQDIIDAIKLYVELRNRVVHYKAGSEDFLDKDSHSEADIIDKEIEDKIDFEELFSFIIKLQNSLEDILEDMSPEYKKAKEIVSTIVRV